MATAWKMVPAEPTEEMLDAGRTLGWVHAQGIFLAMLAAAPSPWRDISDHPAGVGELLLFVPELGWRPADYDGDGNWRSPIDGSSYTDGTHWMFPLPPPSATPT